MSLRSLHLVINGKAVANAELRDAVAMIRRAGHRVEVRVTWESGDARRWAEQADGADVVVAVGGDGTVNEVVHGLMQHAAGERPALGLVPMGSANDFATGCGVPTDPQEALALCATGAAVPIDLGRANERWFINAASSGFGAEVTASTPPELKRLLGGAAYTLMGAILATNFEPAHGRLTLPHGELRGSHVMAVVGNGRQAGGGKTVAPRAVMDDGLLDILVVRPVPATGLIQAARELQELREDGEFISYWQAPWAEFHAEQPTSINLDGEPVSFDHVRFEAVTGALRFIAPGDCPPMHPPVET